MKRFREQGHNVIGICPDDKYSDLIRKEGFEVIALKNLTRKGTNPLKERKLYRELRYIYTEYEVDIVMQYTIKPNIYGTLAAHSIGIKTICNITGLGFTFINKGLVSTISKRLYKMALKRADFVVFQNKQDANLFIDDDIVNPDKVSVCNGSGIDIEKYSPMLYNNSTISISKEGDFMDADGELLKDFRGNNTTHFLLIARLLKDKGILEYIEAANELRKKNSNLRFAIAGDIDNGNPASLNRSELESLIINNPNIEYLGYVNDTREVINNSDCIVLPSYREGIPKVILEAYAMGKPCIVSDAPGCKDVIENSDAGIMVETGSTESLVKGMNSFAKLSDDQKVEMGKNARKLAETKYADKEIFKFYEKLIR